MKIGIDGTVLTIPHHCGIRHYAEKLLETLDVVDSESEYVIFLPGSAAVALPKRFKVIHLPKVPILKRQLFLPFAVAKEKVDVFHFLETYSAITLIHPAIVSTVHDSDLSMTYPWMSRFFLNRLLCEVSRVFVFAHTKVFVTCSHFGAEELKDLFPKIMEKKLLVEGFDGYDRSLFVPDGAKKRGNYFLTMGDFAWRKNFKTTLSAFELYKKRGGKGILKVVVSDKRFLQPYWKLIQSSKFADKVEILMAISSKELAGYYRGALAFLFPSLYEGFGMPIVESMSCGCPVITSNYGAMQETARGGAMLVDPLSPHDIANAMVALEDEKVRKNIRQKGLKAAGHYSWEKYAKIVMKAYVMAVGDA